MTFVVVGDDPPCSNRSQTAPRKSFTVVRVLDISFATICRTAIFYLVKITAFRLGQGVRAEVREHCRIFPRAKSSDVGPRRSHDRNQLAANQVAGVYRTSPVLRQSVNFVRTATDRDGPQRACLVQRSSASATPRNRPRLKPIPLSHTRPPPTPR